MPKELSDVSKKFFLRDFSFTLACAISQLFRFSHHDFFVIPLSLATVIFQSTLTTLIKSSSMKTFHLMVHYVKLSNISFHIFLWLKVNKVSDTFYGYREWAREREREGKVLRFAETLNQLLMKNEMKQRR